MVQAWASIKIVKFSMLHAKNIRRDYGVPIWVSAHDPAGYSVPFDQLIFFVDDPFLFFCSAAGFTCLLYKQIQSAVQSSAKHYKLDGKGFNNQSIQMAVPTIARVAKATKSTTLQMGRWALYPSSLRPA